MLAAAIALLAGSATVAAPCTLPVLPILLGASIAQTSKARPLLIALGFVTSFSGVAIIFGAVTHQNLLRALAVPILICFGLLMLWPQPFEWLVAQARSVIGHPDRQADQIPVGNVGGFFLGTTLGLVWTPCAGPVLGSILTIIATSEHLRWEALLLVAYAIGAAVPMLAIAYDAGKRRRARLASTSARLRLACYRFRAGDVLPVRHLNHSVGLQLLSEWPIRPVKGEIRCAFGR
jgi:cytochrome c biogenesis protein CcdA